MTVDNGRHDHQAQLAKMFQDQEPEFVAKVQTLVNDFGIRSDDPLFSILISTSTLKILLEDAPKQLKATHDYCSKEILENLSAYEAAAAKGTEKRIATAVDKLIAKTQVAKARLTVQTALPVGLIFLITLAMGVMGGLVYARWQANQIEQDPSGPRLLTLEEANALNWALSAEGQLAQKIMSWNDNLANRECEQEIEELGIVYRLGTKQAVSGFCTVWVAPPSDRRFVKTKEGRTKGKD